MDKRFQHIHTHNDMYQILHALKTNRKKRAEIGEVFIEGIEAIKQAAAGGWKIRRILAVDFSQVSGWALKLLDVYPDAQKLVMDESLFRELSDKDTPSEIMVTVQQRRLSLDDLHLSLQPLLLILDRPSDMGNLGALLRSANAFSVDAVVLNGHGVDPYDPKTIRASMGAVFHTPIVQNESADKLEAWLNTLKQSCGLRVAGTDSTGESSLASADIRRPAALILGNEAKGMSVRLKQFSDTIISIPLSGAVNSLNVACAGSILLWQMANRSAPPV